MGKDKRLSENFHTSGGSPALPKIRFYCKIRKKNCRLRTHQDHDRRGLKDSRELGDLRLKFDTSRLERDSM